MHLIMSNNAKDHATAEREQSTLEDSRLKRNLELIWLRIDERFQSFANSFRFFDMNFNNRVSFNEFSQGIETLKVKITLREQMECFNYLDKGAKEYLTYDDFCGLTKERRSQFDPAKAIIEQFRKNQKEQALSERIVKGMSPEKKARI